MTTTRRRPHITMTPSAETLAAIRQIGEENGLYNRGVILDFIIHDYIRIKPVIVKATGDGDGQPDVTVGNPPFEGGQHVPDA